MKTGRPGTDCLTLLLVLLLVSAGLGVRAISLQTPSAATRDLPHGESASRDQPAGCLPSHDGFLRARLRSGSFEGGDLDIDWGDSQMECDGGPRPNGEGMRMMFAGPLPHSQHRLRLVFGLATPSQVSSARNVPVNVTVIFEDEQKLFSTVGDGKCTVDTLTLQPTASDTQDHWQRFTARGFCTEPAGALTGSQTLLLDRFDFAGVVRDD